MSLGAVHDAERVLDADELGSPSLEVAFAATQAGQDDGLFAGDQVGAVELGRYLDGQAAALERLGGEGGVGGGGEEVATHGEEHRYLAPVHGVDGVYRIEPMMSRWGEADGLTEAVEEGFGGPFPDAHGAVALNVAVAAYGAGAGAGAARWRRA